jgi:hypothetical protein
MSWFTSSVEECFNEATVLIHVSKMDVITRTAKPLMRDHQKRSISRGDEKKGLFESVRAVAGLS